MKMFTQILFAAFFTVTFAVSQRNDDESKPYEFGFTVDGQQHRHEKKDVKGIIEGEFGFITADGIYHVTVYATDENGKFKILSMRNLRISAPLDGSPLRGELSPEADKYRKQAGLAPLPQPGPNPLAVPQSVPQQIISTPKSEAPFRFTTQATVKPACASCGFITTLKPEPGVPGNGFKFQNPIFQKQDQELQGPLSVSVPFPSSGPVGVIEHRFGGDESYQPEGPQNIPSLQQFSQYPESNLPQYQSVNGPQNTNYNSVGGAIGTQDPSGGNGNNQYPSGEAEQYPQYTGLGEQNNIGGSPQPNPLQVHGQERPSTEVSSFPPVSVSDGVIHVGGNNQQEIPIKDKYPGMQDGLPAGIEDKDITDILYKFHYTIGFHGHYEKGYKNGAKVGGYFVNGRDGISRVVTYVADENGYRPKVKFINLGLTSDEIPKPETEKTFGLKSFEFVWYPVE